MTTSTTPKITIARVELRLGEEGEHQFLLAAQPTTWDANEFDLILMHNGVIVDDRATNRAAEVFELAQSERFLSRLHECVAKPGQRFDVLM